MRSWTRPADIRARLDNRWARGDFLRAALDALSEVRAAKAATGAGAQAAADTINFPYRLPLRGPTRREMVDHFDQLRAWIEQIRNAATGARFELEWKEVNHRQLGRNEVPVAVVIPDLDRLSRFLGTHDALDRFRSLAAEVATRLPRVIDWLRARPFDVLELEEQLGRLLLFVEWAQRNPTDGMYLRQVDLPGIDTKFLEAHKGVLSEWLNRVLPEERIDDRYGAGRSFEQRYRFSRKPDLVRIRLLDPTLAPAFAGFTDISVPTAELASSPLTRRGVRRVFVVENDISALALPEQRGGVVLFGRGYNVRGLADVGWFADLEVFYWGDIDTHGFAILNEFRGIAPHARSILMDRKTLLAHRDHWTSESSPFRGTLSNLNAAEGALYRELLDGTHGASVRLEQERVRFGAVRRTLPE